MILIDTNILIDYFKGDDTILDTLLDQVDIALCGIILATLCIVKDIHIATGDGHFDKISEVLTDLRIHR